jgi:hypothetical protein
MMGREVMRQKGVIMSVDAPPFPRCVNPFGGISMNDSVWDAIVRGVDGCGKVIMSVDVPAI